MQQDNTEIIEEKCIGYSNDFRFGYFRVKYADSTIKYEIFNYTLSRTVETTKYKPTMDIEIENNYILCENK